MECESPVKKHTQSFEEDIANATDRLTTKLQSIVTKKLERKLREAVQEMITENCDFDLPLLSLSDGVDVNQPFLIQMRFWELRKEAGRTLTVDFDLKEITQNYIKSYLDEDGSPEMRVRFMAQARVFRELATMLEETPKIEEGVKHD